LETLEDELKKEKIANDAEMVGANAQCAECNKEQKDAFNSQAGVDALRSVMEQARTQHAGCRGTEDPNCGDEKEKCIDQDNYAQRAHGAGPQCSCNKDDTADIVKVCLQEAEEWGKEYNTALGNKITACNKSAEVAKNVAKVCDQNQKQFEMAFCSYEVSLSTTCQIHHACYEAAVRNRGMVMTNVKTKEASEKIMWKSSKKVRCFLDMLDASKVSQKGFDLCKQQKTDTSHLDVVYPAAPAKADCDTTPVGTLPGDAAWLKAEYARLAPNKSWLPTRKGIEHVTPCPRPELRKPNGTAPLVTGTAAPSVIGTAAPSVIGTAAPSVAGTAAPSVTGTARPSVTAGQSVIGTIAPSVTGTAAPSESKGCVDTRASGSGLYGDDRRGSYIDGTSSQCIYYKNKNECELWGKGCEKTCGICQAANGTAASSVIGTAAPQ